MVVKRYANRRLYDTDESRYVTLDEVAVRIRAGSDIRFVDAPTGQDITQPILAQLIMESRGAARLLPVPLLYQLIRMGDDALSEFFGRYVTWALQVYLRMKQSARAVAPYNPFANMPFAAAEALARLLTGGAGASGGGGWGPPPPQPMGAAPGADWGPPPTEPGPVFEADAAPAEPPPEAPVTLAPAPVGVQEPTAEYQRGPAPDDLASLRAELEALKAAIRGDKPDDAS